MKKITALFLAVILILSLSACSININTGGTEAPSTADGTAAQSTEAQNTEASATEVGTGALSDYVKTAKEIKATYEDSPYPVVLRMPEILLSGNDAAEANKEISDKFSKYMTESDAIGINDLDYAASLNGQVLSVVIMSRFDGGNSYGLCYNFDVTTGGRLGNEAMCKLAGKDYIKGIGTLRKELKAYYDSRYANLPDNEAERSKTLDDSNLHAASMYIDSSGKLMALVKTYAAVGGGQWIVQIKAE